MIASTNRAELVEEFSEQIEAFRRNFLVRTIALLASVTWATGMIVLFLVRTGTVASVFLGFEALLWLSYSLTTRGRLRLAQYFLILTLTVWSLGLVWLQPHPALLFLPVLVGPIAIAVLETKPAMILAAILVVAQIASAAQIFPDQWLTWPLLLAPLLSGVAVGLALVWSINLYTVLGWAVHSTRTAVERLEEVQEHRAQLHRSMKERDATVQRLERANELLAVARAEAEAARQARNQFSLTVSHELRTPLNFIIGFSELMVNSPETYAERGKWPPGLYEDVKEIYANSNHLLRLVNDILDLGQAEARRLILAKEWVAPTEIVKETETILRAAIAARHLFFRVETAPDLPDLFVDRTRIRQVLINLISNSLRFTEEGGITLSVKRRATEIVFCVLDTGAGIPADAVPLVFDDFGQANTTVWRRRGGSGLGVPISRRFIEMHGGRMWLESELGLGTSFYFSLPLPGTIAEPADTTAEEERWRSYLDQPRPSKVLLVLSPDPNANHLIETYTPSYRVIATSKPAVAGEYIASLLPHALIVDRSLAGGAETGRLIEALPYDLPVIELALPGGSSQTQVLPQGVHAHLLKPVQRGDLARAVENLAHPVRSLLVVDDDPAMGRFVQLALQASGVGDGAPIEVSSMGSGQEVLERLALHASDDHGCETLPDLVLLDVKLGDISGLQVLVEMQAAPGWREVPVILVTAADLRDEMAERTRDILQVSTGRPLTAEELGTTLNALLSSLRPTVGAGPGALTQQASPPA